MVMKKNLISRISSSPFPISHILSVAYERYASGRKKSPLSQHRGVGISTVLKKKTTHSLQVKSLYHRAGSGTDHLKRLKIKDQLQKWLKRTVVTAEGGSPFGGGSGNMPTQRNFEIFAPNEAIWGYSSSFIFFFHFLKSKNFSRLHDKTRILEMANF